VLEILDTFLANAGRKNRTRRLHLEKKRGVQTLMGTEEMRRRCQIQPSEARAARCLQWAWGMVSANR
jgi:hypothetical protein